MNNIEQYTIYCTEEQTKKALKLGYPLQRYTSIPNFAEIIEITTSEYYEIPTAEQIINWLEEKEFEFEGNNHYTTVNYKDKGCLGMYAGARKDTILIAIDDALEYLNNKH